MDEEEEHLLPSEVPRRTPRTSSKNRRKYVYPLLASYVLALHLALASLLLARLQSCTSASSPPPTVKGTSLQNLRSSLGSVITTHHATNKTEYSSYSGPPNSVNRAAWTNILESIYFNASAEELLSEDVNAEAAIQTKGGGYLAALGVYHEMHCLNKLRFFLYIHKKKSTWTKKALEDSYLHLDHCIEVLRLSVMCSSDLSLYTFTFPKDNTSHFLDLHSTTPRKCADWTQVESWSQERRTDIHKGVLVPESDGE